MATKIYSEAEFNLLTTKERLNNTLEGEFYWAWLAKPKVSEKYKTMTYSVNLILDADNKAKAEAMGLKIYPADKYTPGDYVIIQRKVRDHSKAAEIAPEVVDSMQRTFPSNVLIGNKSKGIVKFGRYWFPNGGGGIGTTLFKVQVRHLEEFKATEKGFVMDEQGFKATGTDNEGFDQ